MFWHEYLYTDIKKLDLACWMSQGRYLDYFWQFSKLPSAYIFFACWHIYIAFRHSYLAYQHNLKKIILHIRAGICHPIIHIDKVPKVSKLLISHQTWKYQFTIKDLQPDNQNHDPKWYTQVWHKNWQTNRGETFMKTKYLVKTEKHSKSYRGYSMIFDEYEFILRVRQDFKYFHECEA
jgi:hypothetical protein